MTTVAYKDGIMCSDSQATRGDFIDNTETKKVFNVNGVLIGISGNAISAMKFVEWFENTMLHAVAQEENPFVSINMPESLVEDDFMAMVVYPDESIWEFHGCDKVMQITQDYFAVGSGMFYALSVMDNGGTAEEAVAVAIKRDVYSGGDIQKFELGVEEEPYTKEDFEKMSKEEIMQALFGEENSSELDEVVSEPSGVMHFEQGVYELKVYSDGKLDCCDDEPLFTSFVETQDEFGVEDLKMYADLLGVKFPHNIGQNTLAQKLDDKVKEIIDNLNQ